MASPYSIADERGAANIVRIATVRPATVATVCTAPVPSAARRCVVGVIPFGAQTEPRTRNDHLRHDNATKLLHDNNVGAVRTLHLRDRNMRTI